MELQKLINHSTNKLLLITPKLQLRTTIRSEISLACSGKLRKLHNLRSMCPRMTQK
jgi:hypothetical protein